MDQCSTGTTSHQHYRPPHQPAGARSSHRPQRAWRNAVLTGGRLGQQHARQATVAVPLGKTPLWQAQRTLAWRARALSPRRPRQLPTAHDRRHSRARQPPTCHCHTRDVPVSSTRFSDVLCQPPERDELVPRHTKIAARNALHRPSRHLHAVHCHAVHRRWPLMGAATWRRPSRPATVADHLADECRASLDGGQAPPQRLVKTFRTPSRQRLRALATLASSPLHLTLSRSIDRSSVDSRPPRLPGSSRFPRRLDLG